ncbi:MAG TPA: Spy/CpxP family protein refolding chaperone [Burkholderiales bacterium]|nr:Spy/CpxP family protein refolding chaperone [Burkholderiales bacterium]
MSDRSNPYVRRFLLASSLAFGLGSSAFAQSDDRQGPMPGHAMHRTLRQLDLTEAQRDQVFRIFHDQAPALRSRMKAVRAARGDLEKLASASAFDRERARAIANTEAKAIADMEVMRAESMARVREILTPEQRAKLDQLRERRR